jgi:protein SCO1/2
MKPIFLSLMLALSSSYAFCHDLNTHTQAENSPSIATVIRPSKAIANVSLIDTSGKTFTTNNFVGHWTLLFFGYSHCPDICPRTLTTITQAWHLIPAKFKDKHALRFIFVSLDPKNDTTLSLSKFLHRFDQSFIGLTGDEDTIKAWGKTLGIYSWQDPASPSTVKLDHSATLLLVDPQGRLHAIFSPPHQTEAIAKDLQLLVKH